MAVKSDSVWYSRCVVLKDGLSLKCPRCGADFHVGPMFDHDKRPCLNCGVPLVEWNLMSVVIVVDVDSAPRLVQEMIAYMGDLTEPDAQDQLEGLLRAVGALGE